MMIKLIQQYELLILFFLSHYQNDHTYLVSSFSILNLPRVPCSVHISSSLLPSTSETTTTIKPKKSVCGTVLLQSSSAVEESIESAKPRVPPVVQNFRPVGGLPDNLPLYRCANMDLLADRLDSSKGDEKQEQQQNDDDERIRTILMKQAGLIIDLRSDSERDETKANAWMSVAAKMGDGRRQFLIQRNNFELVSSLPQSTQESQDRQQRIILRLDPLQSSSFMTYLDENWMTSNSDKVQSAMYKIFDGNALHKLRMNILNEKGLIGLYEAILMIGQKELFTALQAMTMYWEEQQKYATTKNSPIVFHCVKGKDRTGLLAMLCQSILLPNYNTQEDLFDDIIINDYYLSEMNLEKDDSKSRKSKNDSREDGKLDRTMFSGSPKIAMRMTLEWVRSKFGSVDGYLDEIGFDESWRQRFRDAAAVAVATTTATVARNETITSA